MQEGVTCIKVERQQPEAFGFLGHQRHAALHKLGGLQALASRSSTPGCVAALNRNLWATPQRRISAEKDESVTGARNKSRNIQEPHMAFADQPGCREEGSRRGGCGRGRGAVGRALASGP